MVVGFAHKCNFHINAKCKYGAPCLKIMKRFKMHQQCETKEDSPQGLRLRDCPGLLAM